MIVITAKNTLLSVAFLSAMVNAAAASTITIDKFDVPQFVYQFTSSEVGSETETTVLGGFREIEVTASSATQPSVFASVGSGQLYIQSDFWILGTYVLTWDGENSMGLGGVDLGVNGAFELATVLTDLPGPAVIEVFDVDSNSSSLSQPFVGGSTSVFDFDDFTGTADFRKVDAIKLTLTRGSNEEALFGDLIVETTIPNSVVPVPAALPLFLSGLVSLSFLGWKRSNKV